MAKVVYLLCMVLSMACAFMLIRAYLRHRSHILLWSSTCFALIAVNCGILVVDMILLPELDFGGLMFRTIAIAAAGSLLLFGLIWEVS